MAPLKSRPTRLAPRASDDTWVHDKAPRDSARPAPANGPPTNKLLITNLHYEVMPKDLMAIFGQIGTLVREPHIRYDRSGRSSGVAVVTYETSAEATRARNQLNGLTAKGQPMTIEFDREIPRRASAPAAPSLLSRIQKPPLLTRLGQSESNAKIAIAKNAKVAAVRGKAKVGAKGRGGGGKGPAPPRQKSKPKTAQELDSELDTFMGAPAPAPAAAPATDANEDVEMS